MDSDTHNGRHKLFSAENIHSWYRAVTQVQLICSAAELQRYGSPLDRLDQARVAVFDGLLVLPEAGLAVLARQLLSWSELVSQAEILLSIA